MHPKVSMNDDDDDRHKEEVINKWNMNLKKKEITDESGSTKWW